MNCKYMKHIFELQMKDQIEERSSQLVRNLSSCEEAAIFYLIFHPPVDLLTSRA